MQQILELVRLAPQTVQAIIDILGAVSLVCTPLSILLAMFGATKSASIIAKFGKDVVWIVAKIRGSILARLAARRVVNGLLVLAVVAAFGCASATPSAPSASTSNGKTWPLCLEVDFVTAIPIVKNWSVLVCATTEGALGDAKQSAVEQFKHTHPSARLVLEARLPGMSPEQLRALHPSPVVER